MIKNLSKLPKRKVTIEEILGSDRVAEMLDEIYDERHDIDELIIIHTSRKHSGMAFSVNGVTESRIIAMLEGVKFGIFNGDFK